MRKNPKLPNILYNGTLQEVTRRANERAAAMAALHPGVRFSNQVPNPVGVRQGKLLNVPGVGLPLAKMDFHAEPLDDPEKIGELLFAYQVLKRVTRGLSLTSYVTITSLYYTCETLTMLDVIRVLKHLHVKDPYGITFSVDRLGNPTYTSINIERFK